MLHTICFARVLGLLKPATQSVLGVSMVRVCAGYVGLLLYRAYLHTQPYVTDEAIIARVERAQSEMLASLDKHTNSQPPHACTACIDVVLGWHKVMSSHGDSTDAQLSRAMSPEPSTTDANMGAHYAVFESPYSWLASAIAGGRSTAKLESRERDARRLLPRDTSLDACDADVFEQWVLSLRIDYVEPAPVASAGEGNIRSALQDFLMSALSFANKHQSTLPPITDSGICPFPFTINSTLRER